MPIKVLVVDNNPVLLRAISAFLERKKCEVKTATNGLEAINLLKKYSPDIICTDLVMPLVGGEQLCKIVRNSKSLKEVFLVVISGIVLEDMENILGAEYYDLCIAKGTLKEIDEHLDEVLETYRDRSKTGKVIATNRAAKIPEGLKPSVVTSELLTEKRHLTRILENLEEGIVELDQNGIVVSLNLAAKNLLDRRDEDLIGLPLQDYPWGEHQTLISQWLGNQLAGEKENLLQINEEFPLKLGDYIITATFFPVRGEKSVFGLCILRDITRQYLAEEHKRKLDNAVKLVKKMDAMSCMAGGIAHDFNNLLTVICGNLDLIVHQGGQTGEDSLKIAKHARDAAYNAVELTRKISCSSPFGIVSRQQMVFETLVEESAQQFFNSQNIPYSIIAESDASMVSIDPELISGALHNILQNSVEATDIGEITISLGQEQFVSPTIISGQYLPAGSYARVSVRDSGRGIPEEDLLKVFDPYFSKKSRGALKGMGLGLTVVYATMRNHGGYVIIESEQGVGTVVSCYLPRYGATEITTMDSAKSNTNIQPHVLLIEPDLQLQEVSRAMLDYLGYTLSTVRSIQEALAFLRHPKENTENPVTVVLVDSTREIVDDYAQLCSSFLTIDSKLKVILTGGASIDPIMKDCTSYGFTNALPKPFTMDGLKHVLMATTE